MRARVARQRRRRQLAAPQQGAPMDGQHEITTTSSRIAYENRWMRVREDRIAYADGSPGLYGVVEKRDFVLVAAREGDRVHLVEQYRYPIRQRQWEFPQGLMEQGETDQDRKSVV